MKKLIALLLTLVCVSGLVGCSNEETTVWDWAQELNQEDVISVTPWRHDDEHKEFDTLSDEETLELVTLLNDLTEDSFTENKNLAGGTPAFGIQIDIASETYYINESISPNGALEIRYSEKMWWIDNVELLDFVQRVADTKFAE